MAEIGHNSGDVHKIARDQLRAFIERVERLEEEKKTIADDIKDVYGEAKAMGYDTKTLRKIISNGARAENAFGRRQEDHRQRRPVRYG